MGSLAVLVVVIVAIALLAALVIVLSLKNLLFVCQPNEVLAFSGRGGTERGYRIVRGGRTWRIPLLETVDRMDLTNMIIEVTVRGAYSKGGIPLTVQGVANVKIPGQEPLIHNSLERFLGKDREEIMKIARETLEGNLRGVLATLTPEQVNQDKEAFAGNLAGEAEHDLNKIGLVLDTLKIQNVSDEVGYLNAIGRTLSAHILRDAQIAEANAEAQAAEVKWDNHMQGELAKLEASIEVARKENDRRIADARTRREALIAEEQSHVQAAIAQAQAEIQMQEARIEQTRLQLEADVIEPARATTQQAVARAKADAAKIVEEGKASAQVLTDLARAYRTGEASGRDVLLMQQLVPVLRRVSGTIGALRVDRLTVIGKQQSDGKANVDEPLAARLVSGLEQVRAATGVDVAAALREKLPQR